MQLYSVKIVTENQMGLLSQIANTYTRLGVNIETISAGPSVEEGGHKYIITCFSSPRVMQRLVNQIDKRIGVMSAAFYEMPQGTAAPSWTKPISDF